MRPRKAAKTASQENPVPQSLRPVNTVPEAARYLQCSQRAVRQLLARNELDVAPDLETGTSGITRTSLEAARERAAREGEGRSQRRLKRRSKPGQEQPAPLAGHSPPPDAVSAWGFLEAELQPVPVKSVACQPLIHILNEVEDFRLLRGRRYRLSALLVFACAAMLCGCQTYAEIVQWGQTHRALIMRYLGIHRAPSIRTLRLIFRGVDSRELNQSLQTWCAVIADLLKQPSIPAWQSPPVGRMTRRILSGLRRKAQVTGADSLSTLGQRLGLWHLTEGKWGGEAADTVLGVILESLFFEGRIAYVGTTHPASRPSA